MDYNINQQISMQLQIKENESDAPIIVGFCNALIDTSLGGYNLSIQIINKSKYEQNKEKCIENIANFTELINSKLAENGYK